MNWVNVRQQLPPINEVVFIKIYPTDDVTYLGRRTWLMRWKFKSGLKDKIMPFHSWRSCNKVKEF